MTDDMVPNAAARSIRPVTPRDLLAILFRQSRVILLTFSLLFLAVVAYLVLKAPAYEAHMSILVKRERIDPVVTTEEAPLPQFNQALAEQDLNSEVELLKSRDLIEKVVSNLK